MAEIHDAIIRILQEIHPPLQPLKVSDSERIILYEQTRVPSKHPNGLPCTWCRPNMVKYCNGYLEVRNQKVHIRRVSLADSACWELVREAIDTRPG